MRGKNIFSAILRSYDPGFYQEIVLQPLGQSLKYLLLLVFFVSLFLSLRSVWELKSWIARFSYRTAEHLAQIMPAISEVKIDKGEVSSPVKQPFIFQKGDFAFILDTTGSIVSLDNCKEGVLLGKSKLTVKTSQNRGISTRTEEYDLAKIKTQPLIFRLGDKQKGEIVNITIRDKVLSVSKENIDKLGKRISLLISPILLLVTFLVSLVDKLFQVFLFSAASLLFNAVLKAKLKYRNLLNIGIYAITPPTLLSLVVILCFGAGRNIILLIWSFFYIFFYIAFLSLAIVRCRQNTETNPLI